MKRNTLFSILATAAFGIVMAGPASATDFVWDGGGDGLNWSDPDNWTADSGYPDDNGDKATLRGDTTIDVDVDVTIGELVIEDDAKLKVDVAIGTRVLTIEDAGAHNGKLTIEAVGELNIDDNGQVTLDGTTNHDIRGEVKLRESGAVLKFADSVTVAGTGKIVGGDNDAKILIAGGKTLTNQMLISGRMTIDDPIAVTPGTFKNGDSGIVRADTAGELSFALGLTLADETACSPSWEATKFGAVLEFNQAATNLMGTFVLDDCSKMRFNASITTVGKLVDSCANCPHGFIDIENSSTFTFRTECDRGDQVSYTTDQVLGNCPDP